MTPAPQQKEEPKICLCQGVCAVYQDGFKLSHNTCPLTGCKHDTRSRPAPSHNEIISCHNCGVPKQSDGTPNCPDECAFSQEHDTAIRNAVFADIEKLKVSTDMGDIVPWCDIQSLHTRGRP